MNTPLDSALALASVGYRVIPAHGIIDGHCACNKGPKCPSAGKHPVITHWQSKATNDPVQITEWWLRNSICNPAIATGKGVVVLDVDGEAGMASLKKLEERYGPLPITRTVTTGSGGKHYHFSCTHTVSNSAGTLGEGLDIRGDGGMAIAPGALHQSGNLYHWDEGRSPAEVPLAPIPGWLLKLLSAEKKQQKADINIDDPIPETKRNTTLNSIGFSLRRHQGKTMKEIDRMLHELNRSKCNPPLPEEEVDSIVRSIDRLERDGGAEVDFADDQSISLICAEDVEDEETKFLIEPYIPEGKLTLIQGNPGEGKTAFAMCLAARVSTGTDFMGIPCEQGNVLILSVEDDLSELKRRIAANGGDLSHCFLLNGASMLSFNSPIIEEYIKQLNARLVIFDPFQSFLGAKVDMHRANETRPVLARLTDVADRNSCATVMIAHMSKALSDTPAVLRSMGSTDIPAACRSVLQIGRVDDNPNQGLIVQVKCSNAKRGKSILFSIEDKAKINLIAFTSKDESNFYTFGKKIREAAGNLFYYEEIRDALKKIVKDNPKGKYVFYSDLGFQIPQGIQPKRLLLTLKAKLEEDGIAIGEFKRKAEKMSVWIEPYVDDFLR